MVFENATFSNFSSIFNLTGVVVRDGDLLLLLVGVDQDPPARARGRRGVERFALKR